jgi:HNH endonuclease
MNNQGYGVMWANGRLHLVHRLSWVFANGPIPDGQWILHRCDTPNCVRPDHLFLGDQFDNMRDRFAKHRYRTGGFDRSSRPPLRVPQLQRFWSRVTKTEDCWIWTGTMSNGCGCMQYNGTQQLAHRISWQIAHGPIAKGLCVCHHCDNRKCVRPDHLFLGTQTDNMRDMRAKGRGHHLPPRRGEHHGMAKLTENDVRTIRSEYAKGGISAYRLAKRYAVSATHIWFIIRRTSWSHVA